VKLLKHFILFVDDSFLGLDFCVFFVNYFDEVLARGSISIEGEFFLTGEASGEAVRKEGGRRHL
jgi:hypothetical protein